MPGSPKIYYCIVYYQSMISSQIETQIPIAISNKK